MAVGFSPAYANAILNSVFNGAGFTAPTELWAKLHTGDPGAAGTANPATETTRKEVTTAFAAPSGGVVLSDEAVTWTSVPAAEDFTHISIWTDETAGDFVVSGTITANAMGIGDTFVLPIADISASITTAA